MRIKLLVHVLVISTLLPSVHLHANDQGEVEQLKALVLELTQRVSNLEARLKENESAQYLREEQQPIVLDSAAAADANLFACKRKKVEQIKAEQQAPRVTSGNDKIKLAISGQVNRAVMYANNGDRSKVFHVDNDANSTRFKLLGEGRVNEEFGAGAQIVLQIESNSSSAVDIIDQPKQGDVLSDRNLEVWFDSKTLGRLWIGKGETASDTTNNIDLSGTNVIADGNSMEEFAGSMSFFDGRNPKVTGPRVKQVWNDFDGLGRTNRIRWDSPQIYGFVLSTSHADTDSYDVALKFAGESQGNKLQFAVAGARSYPDFVQYNGSMSLLLSCGVSASVALGDRHFKKEQKRKRAHANMAFGKLGYQHKWFDIGKTALAVDYGETRNLDQGDDKVRGYGVFLVQRVDPIATEFYWGWRWYQLSRPDTNFKTMMASMVGARVKF